MVEEARLASPPVAYLLRMMSPPRGNFPASVAPAPQARKRPPPIDTGDARNLSSEQSSKDSSPGDVSQARAPTPFPMNENRSKRQRPIPKPVLQTISARLEAVELEMRSCIERLSSHVGSVSQEVGSEIEDLVGKAIAKLSDIIREFDEAVQQFEAEMMLATTSVRNAVDNLNSAWHSFEEQKPALSEALSETFTSTKLRLAAAVVETKDRMATLVDEFNDRCGRSQEEADLAMSELKRKLTRVEECMEYAGIDELGRDD